jgi:glycosyltransferase involved in cell wall biosynthesis
MIPTFNQQALYLETTLRSVLRQDPGPEQMEIVVVDDGSSNGPPMEVIRRVAGDRVVIHAEPKNLGLSGAWNRCIELANGQWIHILHSDDFVLPGFYASLRRGVESEPTAGAAFCRHALCDEDGHWFWLSDLEEKQPGLMPNALARLAEKQRIQTPAMVVRREAYEMLGGFRSDLPHTLDWEMWCRIAARFAVWHTPEILACYRLHSAAVTSGLIRDGGDIQDLARCIRMIGGYLPPEQRKPVSAAARRHYALRALTQARSFAAAREWKPAMRQVQGALRCSRAVEVVLKALFVVAVAAATVRLKARK